MTEMRRFSEAAVFPQSDGDKSSHNGRPGTAPRGPDRVQDERYGVLEQTIEAEIIPRLMMALRSDPPRPAATVAPKRSARRINDATVAEFTRLVLEHDDLVASAYIDALILDGVPLEAIFLMLIAPTARRLGTLWDEDECGFAEVTVGLCRLHRLLRARCPAFEEGAGRAVDGPRVLLATLPGDQHVLGMLIVEEFFRRAGWNVRGGPMNSMVDLTRLAGREWFSVVGLSVSCESTLDDCTVAIRTIRHCSRNPQPLVMVGGSAFCGHPERVEQVGADAMATDGKQAVEWASRIAVPSTSST